MGFLHRWSSHRRSARTQLTTNKSEKVFHRPSRFDSGASTIVSVLKTRILKNDNAASNEVETLVENKHLRTYPLIRGFPVENDFVIVWNFPHHISQTRFGARGSPSNACSLISAALAENIFRKGIHLPMWNGVTSIDVDAASFPTKQNNKTHHVTTKQNILPSRLCAAMVNSIVDGNDRADAVTNECDSSLFNIPTALKLLDSGFGEVAFVSTKSKHGDAFSLLYGNLKSAIEHNLVTEWKQLFFLVMFVERCVLIVYERDTDSIAIFDSHTHRNFGALIAVSNQKNLHRFCSYVIRRFFPETNGLKPDKMKFEMSLLFFKGTLSDFDCPIDPRSISRTTQLQYRNKRPNVFENYERWTRQLQWKPQPMELITNKRVMNILKGF